MGVRTLVEQHGDSLAAMESALWERFEDGLALAEQKRTTGALYLLGYAAEMLLKCRLFRLLGLPDTALWSGEGASLKKAYDLAQKKTGVANPYPLESHHGLLAYGYTLVNARRARCGPCQQWERRFYRLVWEISQEWTVALRYWPGRAPSEAVNRVERCLWWLLLHP